MQNSKNIWLVGTGLMGIEYAKVLKSLGVTFVPIGRGKQSCDKFTSETGLKSIEGGIDTFLQSNPVIPDGAIIAVGIEALSDTTIKLVEYGVKNILLEKPGIAYIPEIEVLAKLAYSNNANILLAYNRRFYSSVLKAKELIEADGGVKSFHFEFTEWSHSIGTMQKTIAEHHNWFLGNSTHLIDTAFYLCGIPKEMSCFHAGSLYWHPSGSVYSGAGISNKNALFSYIANWEAPGRWNLEIMTQKHRYIFKPMEKLQVMNIGSVAVEFVSDIDYSLDEQFKPGLYLQTKAFLEADYSNFITISAQKEIVQKFYSKISNYKY